MTLISFPPVDTRMHQPPGRQTARRRRSCTSLAGKEGTPSCRTYHLPAMLIILLVLIQNFELHMCRQLMVYPSAGKRSPDKLLTIGGSAAGEVTLPEANTPADDKRAGGSRSAPSQPEEIFSAPADEGYDEYPVSKISENYKAKKIKKESSRGSRWSLPILNPYQLTHNL